MTYAQIALTLFGITLIGNIFESKRKKNEKIIKNVSTINLAFLSSFIGLIYVHSYLVIDWTKVTDPVAIYLTQVFLIAAMVMGFLGLLLGIFLLFSTLLKLLQQKPK
jgi:vacuolar-type H+-ATPase subunit I/STV1